MVATQMQASEEDIDAFLGLLTDDVGYTHLPWMKDNQGNAMVSNRLKRA